MHTADTRGLIALDVDGTLLRTDRTMADRTRAALRAAASAGWHVAVVTGRPLPHALPIARDLGVGEFVIAANGATIGEVASGTVLQQASLAGHVVRAAVAAARAAVPELRLSVTSDRGFFAEADFELVAPLTKGDTTLVDDAAPFDTDAVHSTVLFAIGVPVDEILAKVAPVLDHDVHVSPSGIEWSVELTPPGIHKGSGVARLCERLGIEQRDVVAFGDGLNDIEMLSWAGLGVAMGNAEPAVKRIADTVTSTNDEDGVAVFVEAMLAR